MEILIAVLTFGFMIMIHELGHFLAAKSFGMTVHEFSIGMGPKLFKKKIGETVYAISAIPFGGYVMLENENGQLEEDEEYTEEEGSSESELVSNELSDSSSTSDLLEMTMNDVDELDQMANELPDGLKDEESGATGKKKDGSFSSKPIWQRAVVMLAGGVMNLILGFVLCVILIVMVGGYNTTTIHSFNENAISNEQLMTGDKVLEVEGKRIHSVFDFSNAFFNVTDPLVDMVVERDGKRFELVDVEFVMETDEESGTQYLVYDFYWNPERTMPMAAIEGGFVYAAGMGKMVWTSLTQLFTGKVGVQQMSGPVGVAAELAKSLSVSVQDFIMLVAIITINLGIANLLPIPALDGGRLLFLLIEKVTGRPVSTKVQATVNGAFMMLLFGFMILIMFKDVFSLFK